MLHEGSGELQTVTGVELLALAPRRRARSSYRLNVGLIGAEAMLRLFGEPEANERAFERARALPRPARRGARRRRRSPAARPARALVPAEAAVALGLPAARDELRRVRRARASSASRRAPAAPSAAHHAAGSFALSAEGLAGIEQLLSTPLADAARRGLGERAAARGARGVTSSYEEHGGFRLRTLSA